MENTTRDRQMIDASAEVQADDARAAEASGRTTARSLANPRRVRRA